MPDVQQYPDLLKKINNCPTSNANNVNTINFTDFIKYYFLTISLYMSNQCILVLRSIKYPTQPLIYLSYVFLYSDLSNIQPNLLFT